MASPPPLSTKHLERCGAAVVKYGPMTDADALHLKIRQLRHQLARLRSATASYREIVDRTRA